MPVKKSKVEKKTIKKIVKKIDGVAIDVYNIKGKIVDKTSLPKEIFAAKINSQLMAQAVRVYLANHRAGTASTKTRGEVKGSTRKIYRQKGTGRARHGGIRAPIFVGGGIVSGPTPRDYSLKFPKKMKRAALFSAISEKMRDKAIIVIDGLEKILPKTKSFVEVLHNVNLDGGKKILLILPKSEDKEVENIRRSARNVERLSITLAGLINTYDVLNNSALFLMKESIPVLQKTFLPKQ